MDLNYNLAYDFVHSSKLVSSIPPQIINELSIFEYFKLIRLFGCDNSKK